MLNAELDFHRSDDLFLKKLISETDFHAALTKQEVTNFEVRIAVLAPDRQIRPGMSVNVVIDTQTVQQAVSIPIQAVTVRSKWNDRGGHCSLIAIWFIRTSVG